MAGLCQCFWGGGAAVAMRYGGATGAAMRGHRRGHAGPPAVQGTAPTPGWNHTTQGV